MFFHRLLSPSVASELESALPGLHPLEVVPSLVVEQAWTPRFLAVLERVDPQRPVASWLGCFDQSPGSGPASGAKFWVALHMEA